MKTGLSKIAKGVAWFCTVWLALFGIATTPSFAAVIFYVGALTVLPIQAWQDILEKYLPHFRKYKVLGIVVLFFIAILIMPDSDDSAESVDSDAQSATTVESTVEHLSADTESNVAVFENSQECEESEEHGFSVQFIDVGQADAAFIKCDGHYMLIDGGNKSDSDKIYTLLKNEGVSKLDVVVASHAHEDHIGGLPAAYTVANVDLTLCPVTVYNSEAFEDFAEYAGVITVPNVGDVYSLGDARITVLGVNGGSEENDTSIILRIEYGKTIFLFAGDAGEAAEQAVLDSGIGLTSTVLKIAHHGDDSGTTQDFLKATTPQYAVISVGKDNEYGHPEKALLNRIAFHGVELYRTDLHGDITMTSDGEMVTVVTEKEADAVELWGTKEETEQNSVLVPEDSSESLEQENVHVTNSESAVESESVSKIESEPVGTDYVGNVNSKKFHYSWCSSVNKMKESNKYYFNGTRDQMIAKGYDPCGNCHP